MGFKCVCVGGGGGGGRAGEGVWLRDEIADHAHVINVTHGRR